MRPWLAAAIGIALAFAAWRVATLGLADAFAPTHPAAALQWRPEHPEALVVRAEARLRAKDAATARAMASAGIEAAPLDGRGYRTLGMDAEASGDSARANKLYSVAAARGPRDLGTHAWLATQALQAGDFATALMHFDRMLRVQPEIAQKLSEVMIPVAMDRRARKPLVELLASSPPWRLDFTPLLIQRAPDRTALFLIVESLRREGGGLRDPELAVWLDRLIADHEWSRAYLIWAQSLGPEQSKEIGNVFNGRFEGEPSNRGFDWRIGQVAGARIFRSPVNGTTGQALAVAFEDRRVPFDQVKQLLALPPGRYRFTGRVRLDDLRTERGLNWYLYCADSGLPIIETAPLRGTYDWRPLEAAFEVPATGCAAQWLVLRLPWRIAAEQRIGGTAWFDDLKISTVRD